MEWKYNIILQTQLGERLGTLILNIVDEQVEGICRLLGYETTCSGTRSHSGRCEIHGVIRTFMSTISYVGMGTADQECIALDLDAGKYRYHLTGSMAKETE